MSRRQAVTAGGAGRSQAGGSVRSDITRYLCVSFDGCHNPAVVVGPISVLGGVVSAREVEDVEVGVFPHKLGALMRRNDTPLSAVNDVYDALYRCAMIRRVDAQYSLDKNSGEEAP